MLAPSATRLSGSFLELWPLGRLLYLIPVDITQFRQYRRPTSGDEFQVNMNITTQRQISHWERIEVDCNLRVVGKRDVDVESVVALRNRNVPDSLSICSLVSQRIAKSIEANC